MKSHKLYEKILNLSALLHGIDKFDTSLIILTDENRDEMENFFTLFYLALDEVDKLKEEYMRLEKA